MYMISTAYTLNVLKWIASAEVYNLVIIVWAKFVVNLDRIEWKVLEEERPFSGDILNIIALT